MGQFYSKIKTGLKVKDPPKIWNIYCGGNNILMQHAAKSIKLRISIIKTAKHFQTVTNHHLIWFLNLSRDLWRIGRNLIALEKFRKLTNRAVASLQKRLDRKYIRFPE